MRLMLGTLDQPSLLVDIEQEKSTTEFDFWVVNGAWRGTFYNGYVTVHHPWNPHSSLDKVEILSDNQDRLRGEYQEVFNNFNNPDYVAPLPKKMALPAGWDDDIPF
jgi:hypothetical protein